MSQVVVEEKKKRGRKKQNVVLQVGSTVQPGSVVNDSSSPVQLDDAKPLPKKRGRKPKGGKIIPQVNTSTISMNPDPNIILHLKCSIKDISTSFQETYQYDPTVESIQSFNFDENNAVNYLNVFKEVPYVFNLGHGLLPETEPDKLGRLIKFYREYK